MHLDNRAIDWASESDIRLALNNSDAVLEWETVGFTFVKSTRACTIVRSGAMGGDTLQVHGGWKYANPFALEQSWQEILVVARCYSGSFTGPSNLLQQATMRHRRNP